MAIEQLISNTNLSAIILNPNLVTLEIDMNRTSINPPILVPTCPNHLIMFPLFVKTRVSFYFPIGRFSLAIFSENFFNYRAMTL